MRVNVKRLLLSVVVGVAALAGVAGVTLFHSSPFAPTPVAQGQERPHRPAVRVVHATAHRTNAHAAPVRAITVPAIHIASKPSNAAKTTPRTRPRRAPLVPVTLRQVGGREPAGRVLAPGAWINATSVDVVVRMSSAMRAARLQPQVELRRVGRPFTGHPTFTGAIVAYHGAPVLGVVHIHGLRDGVAYRWRVRVHDTLGPNSVWVSLSNPSTAALRVDLARPAAPALALLTPSRLGGWVATRHLALRWTPPRDGSGVRGYSYTLSRSASARPALHLRTGSTTVTVHASGNGLWYFTVRALNYAHSWGPAARLAVRIDTRVPRVRVLSVARGTINPRRVHPLLRLRTGDWSTLRVDVVAPGGRVVRSMQTRLHGPGYRAAINWNGRDARGALAPSGRYTLRISATNRAGAIWRTTRALTIENAPPAFTAYGLSQTGTYNPYNNAIDGPETITATLNEPARVRIEALQGSSVIRSWSLHEARTGGVLSVTWDGSGAGAALPPGGLYTFRAQAVDAAGNRSTTQLGWVVLDHRRIVISLDAQQLWALDGNRVLLTTLVTTGGPELPTPTGDYQIIDRESPFTFHSQDPPGSPYWYPPSPTNFAMLFQVNGYFIHDAPWRSFYGPGSNLVNGAPGTNTGGSHGCVNVPYTPMAWLYNWATMYTPVQVRQDVMPGQW